MPRRTQQRKKEQKERRISDNDLVQIFCTRTIKEDLLQSSRIKLIKLKNDSVEIWHRSYSDDEFKLVAIRGKHSSIIRGERYVLMVLPANGSEFLLRTIYSSVEPGNVWIPRVYDPISIEKILEIHEGAKREQPDNDRGQQEVRGDAQVPF